MYRVALCEDEPQLLEDLHRQSQEILGQLEPDHEIVPFSSAEALDAALTAGAQFDLLCLDILMDGAGKTGMELALDLRRRDEQTSILFITSSTDFLLEGYGARPIQYLLKPLRREALENALQTDLRLNHRPRTVTLRTRGRTSVLALADIWYVESRNHGCIFRLEREEQSFQLTLTQAEELLPREQFSRCHNSFLVNMARIREVTSREVVLDGGARLTIGRRYAKEFQSTFVRYLNSR